MLVMHSAHLVWHHASMHSMLLPIARASSKEEQGDTEEQGLTGYTEVNLVYVWRSQAVLYHHSTSRSS